MILSTPDPLDDNSPCPINGKYHGVPLGKVPASFLDWFLGQPHLVRKYPAVVEYCNNPRVKRAINQDLDDGVDDYGPVEDDDPDYPPRRFWDDEA